MAPMFHLVIDGEVVSESMMVETVPSRTAASARLGMKATDHRLVLRLPLTERTVQVAAPYCSTKIKTCLANLEDPRTLVKSVNLRSMITLHLQEEPLSQKENIRREIAELLIHPGEETRGSRGAPIRTANIEQEVARFLTHRREKMQGEMLNVLLPSRTAAIELGIADFLTHHWEKTPGKSPCHHSTEARIVCGVPRRLYLYPTLRLRRSFCMARP